MDGIPDVESFVQEKLGNDTSGHDWYHCFRVRTTACELAKHESGCDIEIVIYAALLHDIPDPKLVSDIAAADKECVELMHKLNLPQGKIDHVMSIIHSLSFKGANVDTTMRTIEGKVVQDADRLDAIGAIGVARCFAYSGSVGTMMYDPQEKPVLHNSEAEYRKHKGSAIAHFSEKLLLLKDMMQTRSGRAVAESRHEYLNNFLNQFLTEWNGTDIDELLNKNSNT